MFLFHNMHNKQFAVILFVFLSTLIQFVYCIATDEYSCRVWHCNEMPNLFFSEEL
jgi:hypothetical protein